MDLFEQITSQKQLSQRVLLAVRAAIRDIYYPDTPAEDIQCGDMSSFARGTNTDAFPDMDLIFFNAPLDESRGYKDWTAIGTRELVGKKEGITSLEELRLYDARLTDAVLQVGAALENCFQRPQGMAQFNFVRTWPGYPGVVFNLSLPHPQYGELAFDIDIDYSNSHYGVEHARRFAQYFQRVVSELDAGRAVQLVEEIKRLKVQAKNLARDADGWIDRAKKLPGFVIEGLFVQRFPPYTYAELMAQIVAHHWNSGREPTDRWVGDQRNQIIAAGFSFSALLENMACDNASLTKGAWGILLEIAQTQRA
ncbi:MAG: hypothetical protein HN413_16745 [Chloroflexi bacterium]|jgi:hypothetical protein|nr:hypothetical protein [Chloroflexota bacterium]